MGILILQSEYKKFKGVFRIDGQRWRCLPKKRRRRERRRELGARRCDVIFTNELSEARRE